MIKTQEKVENYILPVITLKGIVPFSDLPISLELGRKKSVAACKKALSGNGLVYLIPEKELIDGENETEEPELFHIGIIATVKELNEKKTTSNVILECGDRVIINSVEHKRNYTVADGLVKSVFVSDESGVRTYALIDEARKTFRRITRLLPHLDPNVSAGVSSIGEPGLLADFIAANILMKYEHKLSVLSCFDPLKRLETVIIALENESKIFECEFDIHQKVREALDGNQRDFYLREQLNVIKDELGMNDDDDDFENKIKAAGFPEEVEAKLLKENNRLSRTPFGAAESTVLRTYIETCLDIPWNKLSPTSWDVEKAKKILEKDHDGMNEVKERILEIVAIKQRSPHIKSQILCLVGPPGTGKTSIVRSAANAMGRKYVRVALGGVRDEAEIRGHRKTYVGAMPGRITAALIEAGVRNPVILFDEIDKMSSDFKGDPASALLEVLDGAQNKYFRDHFTELPIDLSECVFVCTANSLESIPSPLLDRMEIIRLSTYTESEKLAIAKNHLVPRQMEEHAIKKAELKFTDEALLALITSYTHEAGVRNLERCIASICRKAARGIVEGKYKKLKVTEASLSELLGKEKVIKDKIPEKDLVGVVNGLAYTEYGGSLLQIEVAILEGTGKITLTGSLGDVMKESASIAVSFIRSRAKELNIDGDFYKTKDIHIHAPEGAVPKDGPSAGVAMAVALASALTGKKIKRTVAMTGELSLTGRAMAIGGLKEKSLAAIKAGADTVLIPRDNLRDLEKFPDEIKDNIRYIAIDTADEALSIALISFDPIEAKEEKAEKKTVKKAAKKERPAARESI